jgi:23S rRNA (adenine2503-C2)-methyltransferase
MGIGEPLDNYDAVLRAVRIINDPHGLGIGARRITLSTCGLIPGIDRLAGEGIQVELSVSLHAADDALRSSLMPVNRQHPVAALLEACDRYTQRTRRIVTYEYTLVSGVNDGPREARALAERLTGRACRVNLIPLSPVDEFAAQPPTTEAGLRFCQVLKRAGINTTVRASKGTELQAGCGQLRYRKREG